MEPGKTSFFQALGVPTKIARGTIEITSDLKLVEAGAKVGASEATLLNMLNISPFTYGMKVIQVYEDGQAFSPDVLDIEESQLLKAFSSAIATITTISLAANYPTLPSVIHSVINAYKKTIAVAIETDYSWDAIHELKDRIANPDAYASAAPAAAAATDDAPAAAKEEEKKEESEAEESGDEGMGDTFILKSATDILQDLVVSSTRRRSHETCPANDCSVELALHAATLPTQKNDQTRISRRDLAAMLRCVAFHVHLVHASSNRRSDNFLVSRQVFIFCHYHVAIDESQCFLTPRSLDEESKHNNTLIFS